VTVARQDDDVRDVLEDVHDSLPCGRFNMFYLPIRTLSQKHHRGAVDEDHLLKWRSRKLGDSRADAGGSKLVTVARQDDDVRDVLEDMFYLPIRTLSQKHHRGAVDEDHLLKCKSRALALVRMLAAANS
jgi:hypothetical protein